MSEYVEQNGLYLPKSLPKDSAGEVLARLRLLEPPKSYDPNPGSQAELRKRKPISDFLSSVDMPVAEWDWLQEQTKKMHRIVKNQVIIAIMERAMKESPEEYQQMMGGASA